MPGPFTVETERLRLNALDRDALQAWLDGDTQALFELTATRFADPPEPPPLFGEDLPMFRDRMAEAPDELGWWVWLVTRRDDGRAVGVCGLGGRPDEDGVVVIGYSVYPEMEGRGYATEAARAVVAWAMYAPRVARVRATVPTGNPASLAVARKLGMAQVGSGHHPDVGEVAVYEVTRDEVAGQA
jgi:RimJ/RimL family protein N-acetyltransferase